ncbi:MAG: hypothetical protein IJH37_05880 [Clostridia bacterium]|nr:hypothetical protein [Clostridia bacterium]
MERTAVCVISAIMILLYGCVYAAEYNTEGNYVTGITNGVYRRVLILKDDGDSDYGNIVYIDESQRSPFSTAATFMLKDDLESGRYILRMTGDSGEAVELTFYIGMPIGYFDQKSDYKWQSDSTVSFGWEDITLSEYNSVLIVADSKVSGIPLSDFVMPDNIDGSVNIGLRLTGVSEELDAYLSRGVISESGTLDISA